MRPLDIALRAVALTAVGLLLSGCLAMAVGGAVVGVAGAAVGVTVKGVGMAAGAVIPGGGKHKKD